MDAVFEATKVNFSLLVAIKMMNAHLTKKADAVARFQRAIEAASALGKHPNIVCALDAGAVNNVHYLVMKLVHGADFQSVIDESGPVSEQWGCGFIRQAAVGLQHAHAQQMVHRDIKPANLLLSNDSEGLPVVKILDMGSARFTSQNNLDHLTSTGQIMGSIDYISPEQSRDTHTVDIRGDIFSLGCSLFFLLTGRPPYEGDSPVSRLMNRVYKAAPLIRSVRADISEPVERIIAKMLERQPGGRFQTPADLANELAQCAGTIGQTTFNRPYSPAQLSRPAADPNATNAGAANTTQNPGASNIAPVKPVQRLVVTELSINKQDSDLNADFKMFLKSMGNQAEATDVAEPFTAVDSASAIKPNVTNGRSNDRSKGRKSTSDLGDCNINRSGRWRFHMVQTDQTRRNETQKWLDELPGPSDLLPVGKSEQLIHRWHRPSKNDWCRSRVVEIIECDIGDSFRHSSFRPMENSSIQPVLALLRNGIWQFDR